MTQIYYSRIRFRLAVAGTVLCVLSSPAYPQEHDYTLIIRGGKIVDGTGNPWFAGDVAVRGDRIAALGDLKGTASRELDARGLVIAPGFIDIHSHSDWTLFEDGDAQSKIRQGVTTEILGEGNSAGPYRGRLSARSKKAASGSTIQNSARCRLVLLFSARNVGPNV